MNQRYGTDLNSVVGSFRARAGKHLPRYHVVCIALESFSAADLRLRVAWSPRRSRHSGVSSNEIAATYVIGELARRLGRNMISCIRRSQKLTAVLCNPLRSIAPQDGEYLGSKQLCRFGKIWALDSLLSKSHPSPCEEDNYVHAARLHSRSRPCSASAIRRYHWR